MLSVIQGMSHSGFSDLPLILLLELRLCMFTPSLAQLFRARYNIKLVLDITKGFFLLNNMSKESGNYKDLITRLESTEEVTFDLK